MQCAIVNRLTRSPNPLFFRLLVTGGVCVWGGGLGPLGSVALYCLFVFFVCFVFFSCHRSDVAVARGARGLYVKQTRCWPPPRHNHPRTRPRKREREREGERDSERERERERERL